jgi:hypothetical protein
VQNWFSRKGDPQYAQILGLSTIGIGFGMKFPC